MLSKFSKPWYTKLQKDDIFPENHYGIKKFKSDLPTSEEISKKSHKKHKHHHKKHKSPEKTPEKAHEKTQVKNISEMQKEREEREKLEHEKIQKLLAKNK